MCHRNKNSEGFNFIVSTLNVVNPKFVQPNVQNEIIAKSLLAGYLRLTFTGCQGEKIVDNIYFLGLI